MTDLTIGLEDKPGALAEMGEVLGRAGVSIEGGGVWAAGGRGVAHFLFEDGAAARRALEGARIRVLAEREVLALRLKQGVPGQLGMLARRMADAGVNIEVQYSDHQHQLILVVDDIARGRQVSEAWTRETAGAGGAARGADQGADKIQLFNFARFHAAPGNEDGVAQAILDGLAPTRAEPGCVSSNGFRALRDRRLFFIHSRWKDEAAFNIHAEMPHTVRFIERVEALVDQPLDINRTERIG